MIVNLKTRREIYAEITEELLRCVKAYHCILPEQAYRLFSEYDRVHTRNVISRLLSRREMFYDEHQKCLLERSGAGPADKWMLRAIWVLLDHLEGTGSHTAGEYPVKLSFVQGGTLYDVAAAAPGEELLVSLALQKRQGEHSPCIVVLEYPEQKKEMDCPEDTVFCTVAPNGAVHYIREKENAIEFV